MGFFQQPVALEPYARQGDHHEDGFFVIFDRMTALDLIGVYDPLTPSQVDELRAGVQLADLRFLQRKCSDDRGLRFTPDTVAESLES